MSLVQKNVKMNYVLNVYLSFGQVNTNSHLSHKQNNLSPMSGHRVFHTLLVGWFPMFSARQKKNSSLKDGPNEMTGSDHTSESSIAFSALIKLPYFSLFACLFLRYLGLKEALSVLMLCAPVFIFTSGSSALFG